MKYSKYCLILLLNLLIAIFILYKITSLALKWVDIYTKHGSYVIVPNLRYLTLNQSISILKKLGLKYDVDTSHYDPSFKPYQVLSFFPEAGDPVKVGRYIYIQANAKKFQTTVLPNIINKNKRIAIKLLHANHILVKDIKYVNDLSKDTVLKVVYKGKIIPSGSILPHQDGITLIIGKGYEKNDYSYPVPNVTGMSLSNATYTLKEKLFNIINFYYDDPLDDDTAATKAKVYRQEPSPGKKQDKKKPIYLWLTTKPLDRLIKTSESNESNKNYSTKNMEEEKIPINKEIDEQKTKPSVFGNKS
ncbi:PASTA domain-containing protein [Blattabacterium cuenoti]|uniref:PASTA domain-containing protein n=1 Tax=Blattabacterium cuenoti TaxID=1653831 RepID=UPI00163B7E4C|nr:PASTA domain-containing protein [Blattabacterium cuenoti]